MPTKKHISNAARRRQNHLRLQGLKVADVYMTRLEALRRKELKRVLALCRDNYTPDTIPLILQTELREGYLMGWWQKLWMTAGPGAARATAEELRQEKAAAEDNFWLRALRTYATQRAGENISIVSGTWKDSLVRLTRSLLQDNPGMGVEKLTGEIFRGYRGQLEEWQCRRIAQTETLIGMADAGRVAADTLEIPFTKQWCTSGLPNVRESHQEVDGVVVDENEPFELPGGSLMYPHDTSMQADASEIINCACACIRMPKNDAQSVVAQESAPFQEAVPVQPDPEEARIRARVAEMEGNIPEDVRRKIAEADIEFEKALGVKQGAAMNYDDANKGKENPNYSTNIKSPYHVNCQTCTVAHELRRRGFNITAKSKTAGWNKMEKDPNTRTYWMERFLNPDGSAPTYSRNTTQMRPGIFIEKETAAKGRYEIYVQWKGGGAHVFMAERNAAGFRIFDPQTGSSDAWGYLTRAKEDSIRILRTDDKIINPRIVGIFSKSIKKAKSLVGA